MLLTLPVLAAIAVALWAPFSALVALLLLPAAYASASQPWRRGAIDVLMLAWLIWVPLSLAWSMTPGLSLPQVAALLCLPFGWLAGRSLMARGGWSFMLSVALPAVLLWLILWGVLQGPDTPTGKPQGPFNDPNVYAATLNLLLLPVLARYLGEDLARRASWWRTSQLALLAGAAVSFFLAASRGATLALLLVLPFILWVARRQAAFPRKVGLLAVVGVSAFLATLFVTGGADSVAASLASTAGGGGDYSRLALMHSAWLMIQDHPWLGTGLGSFRLLYPQYRYATETGTAGGWVHNDYLQLWLEAGLPMLLLLTGLALWVAREGWYSLVDTDDRKLAGMGFLAGLAAIFLHALVNFLLYFPLISLLMGLYLAHWSSRPMPLSTADPQERRRPRLLAAAGYSLVLGFLFFGQVMLEGLLGQAPVLQRMMLKMDMAYPRYDVAYWLSVLSPFHPMPHQVMGIDLADGYAILGGTHPPLREDALNRMEAAWRRAPCYLPFANDALALMQQGVSDEGLRARAKAIVDRNLECNARHGLSYFHAGRLALFKSETGAMEWWYAGLAASSLMGERLLLAAAILSQTNGRQMPEMAGLALRMAESLRAWEAVPGTRAEQSLWDEAQFRIKLHADRELLELVYRPMQADSVQAD